MQSEQFANSLFYGSENESKNGTEHKHDGNVFVFIDLLQNKWIKSG